MNQNSPVHLKQKRVCVWWYISQGVGASKAFYFIKAPSEIKTSSCELTSIDRNWCWEVLEGRKSVTFSLNMLCKYARDIENKCFPSWMFRKKVFFIKSRSEILQFYLCCLVTRQFQVHLKTNWVITKECADVPNRQAAKRYSIVYYVIGLGEGSTDMCIYITKRTYTSNNQSCH